MYPTLVVMVVTLQDSVLDNIEDLSGENRRFARNDTHDMEFMAESGESVTRE